MQSISSEYQINLIRKVSVITCDGKNVFSFEITYLLRETGYRFQIRSQEISV